MSNFRIKEKWLIPEQEIATWRAICVSLRSGSVPARPEGLEVSGWVDYLRKQRISGIVYGESKNGKAGTTEQDEIRGKLKDDFIRLQSLRKIRESEATAILSALGKKNIEPVILKGLYLQNFVYGDDLVRPSSDIDLLITDPKGFEMAVDVVAGLGYRKFLYYSDGWERKFMKSTTMVPCDKGLYFEVDCHRSLVYGIYDKRRNFDRALMSEPCYERAQFRGLPVKVLSPEANFAYMAYHALEVHHDCRSFLWLYDLVKLLDLERFSIARLKEIAREAGCEELIEYSLYLVARVTGPNESGFPAPEITKDRKEHSFREKFENIDGVINKAAWLGLWLFPSKEYLRNHYGSAGSGRSLRLRYVLEKIKKRRTGISG